ncbi:MAG TPA: TauD/TfdA family dioxygenase, partial [Burkholderiales bacterium]|nr:TauD/TfdA family dioxygenase [Burkholderiales bacterium]
DFHTDSADMVFLSCYNKAASGGMSITTSSLHAYRCMAKEHPELIDYLHEPIHFSRQGEQAPDEAPSYPHPIFDEAGGLLFSKWNRNRVTSAQKLEGVPQMTPQHREALEAFDALVRRADLTHTMWLEPGDVQIINSHVTLHSRTDFVDHDDAAKKRLLFRLWLAPPDGPQLPESWRVLYKAVEPATVRGGIIGQQHDETRKAFEARQASDLGMTLPA